jgi:hypothetical protein
MKKFLVLYSANVSAGEQIAKTTPEMAKAGMDAWMAWAKKAGSAVVDLGMPLGNPMKVTPTAATPGSSQVAGFSILQAESSNAIAERLKQHPHFKAPGGRIEVFEFLSLPGMPK